MRFSLPPRERVPCRQRPKEVNLTIVCGRSMFLFISQRRLCLWQRREEVGPVRRARDKSERTLSNGGISAGKNLRLHFHSALCSRRT